MDGHHLPALLPIEVLQLIMGELSVMDSPSLLEACLVNRAFQLCAERQIYRSVSIRCHHLLFLRLKPGGPSQFGSIDKLCHALLGCDAGTSRRGYIQHLSLENVSRELLFNMSAPLQQHYFILIKALLSSLPALESLELAFFPHTQEHPDHLDDEHDPTLLFSDLRIPYLRSFRLVTDTMHNPTICAFLNFHKLLTAVTFDCTFHFNTCELNAIADIPPLRLPEVKHLGAREDYFLQLSPDSGGLVSASITWERYTSDYDQALSSLTGSRSTLQSLQLIRPGSNADVVEYISEWFPNLKSLKVIAFMGSTGDSARPEDVNDAEMYRIATALSRLTALEEFEYNNRMFLLLDHGARRGARFLSSRCKEVSETLLGRLKSLDVRLQQCRLFDRNCQIDADGSWSFLPPYRN